MIFVAIISLALTIAGIALLLANKRPDVRLTALVLASVFGLVTIISGYLAIMPEYRLQRAEVEKRILVEQAEAEADAAVAEARAEVEHAKGTAEANMIVADSITEPYLRYLYIRNLRDTENQVIYLPTEAGLPILEADRFAQNK